MAHRGLERLRFVRCLTRETAGRRAEQAYSLAHVRGAPVACPARRAQRVRRQKRSPAPDCLRTRAPASVGPSGRSERAAGRQRSVLSGRGSRKKYQRRRADDEGLTQVVAVLGDERATGLESSAVDLVFICDTYHHIEYPQNYLNSLFETLRPGGVLVLIDFERIRGFTSPQIMQHVCAGKQTVVEEVTGAGFVLDTQVDLLSENYYLRFKRP